MEMETAHASIPRLMYERQQVRTVDEYVPCSDERETLAESALCILARMSELMLIAPNPTKNAGSRKESLC